MRKNILIATVLLVGALCSPASGWAAEGHPFGIAAFEMAPIESTEVVNEGTGERCVPCKVVNKSYAPSYTRAGGHPWAFGATVRFDTETTPQGRVVPTRDPKDVVVDLPRGLIGNPQAAPQCPLSQFLSFHSVEEPCPAASQIGVVRTVLLDGKIAIAPIINVTPEAGQSAEFGLETGSGVNFLLTAHVVKTNEGYGIAVESHGIAIARVVEAETVFWGVPSDPSHDRLRGMACGQTDDVNKVLTLACVGGGEHSGSAPTPFLTLPSDCAGGPVQARVRADSWEEPGTVHANGEYIGYAERATALPTPTGCDVLEFKPTFSVNPETTLADEPDGLAVNVLVPQNESAQTSATPPVRDATVTLAEGISISPGAVDGAEACSESGPEGINFVGRESEEVGSDGELQLAPGHCPDASIVGTVEAITPLLPSPVKGHVYLAKPGCGGVSQPQCAEADASNGTLYKLYLELGGTGSLAKAGVNLKLEGAVHANPVTGQLTTIFLDNPPFPFSELKVRLTGGPRASVANPSDCGPATSMADFTPWSLPGPLTAGDPDAALSRFFSVDGCSDPAPLSPGFVAGTLSTAGGRYAPFVMNLTRVDREQYFRGLQVHMPPGLIGTLSTVTLCPEPAASEGICPQNSKIGITRVASGAGSHPFEISGDVYLTVGYKGAPFGLSVVTNVAAGPFNLGRVVVRGSVSVDPTTTELTITTDPLPQIVFGVPLRLQRVVAEINRPNFMVNPTNCDEQHITALVEGSQGARTSVTSRYAAGLCKTLAFSPKFTVSASGGASKVNGIGLDTKLSFPQGALGTQANIAAVKVTLPRQLPSRLETLQQACTAKVFEENPANCPAASIVGIARSTTPVLPVTLEGPVYFVSHGGEAFPSLIIVLQGDNVRIDVEGSTFISKAGITTTTFRSVPDAPVRSFELFLPAGRYSALGAPEGLCHLTKRVSTTRDVTTRLRGHVVHRRVKVTIRKPVELMMPTEFRAQNGTVLRQSTPVRVTGCKRDRGARGASGRLAATRR